jgi:hypothetical protein
MSLRLSPGLKRAEAPRLQAARSLSPRYVHWLRARFRGLERSPSWCHKPTLNFAPGWTMRLD